MKKFLFSILLYVLSQSAFAQAVELYKAPLPALKPGQEVVMHEVTMPPASEVPAHRHDSHVYVYVLEGEVDMQVEGAEVRRVAAGQVFTETPEDVHLVMRNPSDSVTARFLSVTIKPADIPGFELVDQGRE